MTKTLPALPATDAKAAAGAETPRLGGLSPLLPPAASVADAGKLRLGGLSPLFADAGRLRMGGLSPVFGRG